MKKYSKKLKDSVIARMLPPGEVSIPDLEKETGISRNTLYGWRIKHRNTTRGTGGKHCATNSLNSEDKFSIVVETAGLNEVELSQANARPGTKVNRKKVRNQAKEIKDLKKELHYKEKALAETAALLVLKKNSTFFWGSQRTTNRS